MKKIEKILELLFKLEKEVETATPEELQKLLHEYFCFGGVEIIEEEAPNKTKKVYKVTQCNPYTGKQPTIQYGSKRGIVKDML